MEEPRDISAVVPPPRMPRSVAFYVAFVTVAAGVATWFASTKTAAGDEPALALVGFFALLVLAERFDVRFRLSGQIDSLNLFEAVLAPLMFAFGGTETAAVVALSWMTSGIWRRNEPVKAVFNVANWTLAASCGVLLMAALRDGTDVSLHNLAVLLLSMGVVGVVNQGNFAVVVSLAQRRPMRLVLRGLSPVIVPGWVIGWAMNTLIGLLFVLAFESSAFAVLLFFVPLAVLHAAYRGYAGMQSDRLRLAGLHRASRLLSMPTEPGHGVADFLAEVGRCFDARAAELLLVQTEGIVVHQVRRASADTYVLSVDSKSEGLRWALVDMGTTARVSADEDTPLARKLDEAGWRGCLMAPLPSDNLLPGALVVYDQDGIEGFEEGERAVLEALARETASSFEKGRLFAAIVEERHKLSQIVESTSDGVLTLTTEGRVRSWNRGWELITGYPASRIAGRLLSDAMRVLDADGNDVPIDRWAIVPTSSLPSVVQVRDRAGAMHWLDVHYRSEVGESGAAKLLTVLAHDTTDEREIEQLREDVDRLVELEAAQRARVLELQDSLQPAIPVAAETEFGVYYLPSDTNAPTGGDFYDWQILPDGDVHVAVVDVLGHGVEAANDALTTIHLLRMLAFQGVPVEQLVQTADHLLTDLDPELVATAMIVRYSPSTGRTRLAGGGHPPPLLLRAGQKVSEVPAPGVPIGWPGAGSDSLVEIVLQPSDTLVLYTDGLVEAQRDILQGLEALATNAAQMGHLPAEELARELVERSLEGAVRRDDSLALVVRHSGPTSSEEDPRGFGHRGVPVIDQVPTVRRRFVAWFEQHDASARARDELTMVVSELTANAVRVAERYFEVRAVLLDDGIVIEVEDDGPGFDEEDVLANEPEITDESGRGLFIVRSLVDEMSVRATGRGCVVRLFKRFETPVDAVS